MPKRVNVQCYCDPGVVADILSHLQAQGYRLKGISTAFRLIVNSYHRHIPHKFNTQTGIEYLKQFSNEADIADIPRDSLQLPGLSPEDVSEALRRIEEEEEEHGS